MRFPRPVLAALLIALFWPAVSLAQSTRAVLAVPYVKQSAGVCDASAANMVLRYWRTPENPAADLTAALECTEKGLAPEAVAAALRARGWKTDLPQASTESPAKRLSVAVGSGHPVIALLRDTPDLNHYVVVVAATPEEVVVHDPKDQPYRVYSMPAFEEAWERGGRWMLIATPSEAARAPDAAAVAPCADLIRSGVERAASDAAAADRALSAATRLCPSDPRGWRELALLRLSESRWRAAAAYAREAADLDPEDRRSWEVTGSTRFLSGDVLGALRAWNHIDRPVLSAVEIHDLRNTRVAVVQKLVGLKAGTVLTADNFIRAQHRLEDLPVAVSTRIKYAPSEDGSTARVDVYVDERDIAPSGAFTLAALGAGGLIMRDLGFDIAGPSGRGEDWSARYTWKGSWKRLETGLDVPMPGRLPGIASFFLNWEQQVFAPAPGVRTDGDRKTAGFAVSDWITSWLRWSGGASLDRFDSRNYAAVQGDLQMRLIRDHAALTIEGGRWLPTPSRPGFGTFSVWMTTRSTTRVERHIWLTTVGFADATELAPYQLWAGAGASRSADAFLRGHPLSHQGVIDGEVFGRGLAFASVEYNRPLWRSPAGPIQWAAFVDTAQAWHRAGSLGETGRLIDVGAGLRLRPPALSGLVRIDVARGLQDHRWRASVSMVPKWPRR